MFAPNLHHYKKRLKFSFRLFSLSRCPHVLMKLLFEYIPRTITCLLAFFKRSNIVWFELKLICLRICVNERHVILIQSFEHACFYRKTMEMFSLIWGKAVPKKPNDFFSLVGNQRMNYLEALEAAFHLDSFLARRVFPQTTAGAPPAWRDWCVPTCPTASCVVVQVDTASAKTTRTVWVCDPFWQYKILCLN